MNEIMFKLFETLMKNHDEISCYYRHSDERDVLHIGGGTDESQFDITLEHGNMRSYVALTISDSNTGRDILRTGDLLPQELIEAYISEAEGIIQIVYDKTRSINDLGFVARRDSRTTVRIELDKL